MAYMNENGLKKGRYYHGLRKKFIAWFTLLIIIMITVLCGFYYFSIRENVFELYSKKTQYAVQLSAKEIDGDKAMQYLSQGYIDEDFTNSDEKIRHLKKMFGLKYLYLVQANEEKVKYIYEAYNPGDNEDDRVYLGEEDDYGGGKSKIMQVLSSGEATQSLDIRVDEKYGYLASAYAPVFNADGKIVAIMVADCEMQEILDKVKRDVLWVGSVIAIIIIGLVALYAWFIDKQIVLPIKRLTQSASLVVERCEAGTLGDDTGFNPLLVKRNDEISELETSFYTMTTDLQIYIKNLEDVTTEKQKIETELNVAKSIQDMLLPKIFPPFQKTDNFAIYATVEPAKSVGGDYYDFYMVDEDHICFTIADVSGKGVPAALFMVIAKTIMKNQAMQSYQPAEVLYQANEQLSADNDEGMFVTAFFAVFEISTGRLTYANAGHNPPLLYRKDGSFEYLKMRKSVVLAAMDGMKFTQDELILNDGDMLFTYTDGVTEALNEQEELYSEAKLAATLNAIVDKSMPLPKILQVVRQSIASHVQDAEQSDDITMLAFRKR